MSASQSFIFLIAIQRICGPTVAGGYSIAYAIAQLMWTVGVFEITTYFATDIDGTYTPEQYLAFKIATSVLMVVTSVIYTATFHFDTHDLLITYLLCIFKLTDAFNCFFYALFQRIERLDVSGFGLFWQNAIATISFLVILPTTHNLIAALVVADVCQIAWTLPFYIGKSKELAPLGRPDWSLGTLVSLTLQLLPLFLATFLSGYLSNIPKYALESFATRDAQAIFGILYMPSFVINLFVQFFLRPSVTRLSILWTSRDFSSFFRRTGILLLCTVGITAAALVVAQTIGIPVLEAVFAIDLSGTKVAFLIIVLSGGILAACTVMYNCLVVVRGHKFVLVAYAVSVTVGVLIAPKLVKGSGLLGSGYVCLITAVVLFVCYLVTFVAFTRRKTKSLGASEDVAPIDARGEQP